MTGLPEQTIPYIVHDGIVIVEVSHAFCELFRCDGRSLIDQKVESIIFGAEYRALAHWRGQHIMNAQNDRTYEQDYEFYRHDGSRFWGRSISRRIDSGQYLTQIRWQYDVDP